MAEIVALWIVCNKIGILARARQLPARPLQSRAVVLWFLFEILGAFVGAMLGLSGVLLYVVALCGALLSLKISFSFDRVGSSSSANRDHNSFDDFPFGRVTTETDLEKKAKSNNPNPPRP